MWQTNIFKYTKILARLQYLYEYKKCYTQHLVYNVDIDLPLKRNDQIRIPQLYMYTYLFIFTLIDCTMYD